MTMTTELADASLCADCHTAEHGYTPAMGDTGTTFRPGTCDTCRRDRIVFALDIG